MDQQLWNLLFGWITGRQCFIPEGCSPPAEGVALYLTVLLVVAAVAWKRKEVKSAWRRLRS